MQLRASDFNMDQTTAQVEEIDFAHFLPVDWQ